ncbi:uncharacterized protein MYCFIDRAFT_27250 [Pseudocercospora fijiensis CIRAD86]|uniref:Solute carrier family 66 member 3 n=1 Tax=Pseudocercospora fijiensis (strain CIRAD86) TaxID=383855 RepID=N1Q8F3_PSEFD|nr:uncharacterized protein MYCFIDRAFT_27250 [Pseudocercospora fijiensis CIRAD86]EME89155.1 hypothetical protein MYCFIDRAFT_27250 [Pseudocercospora fijiensis CIRAD86]
MESLESTLRQFLTPITQNLPTPITNLATQLLGDSCSRSLIHNLTITDTVCLKLAISKALGIAIIAASSIVKIPQLLKLLNSQSAEGISFLSYLLETSSYLITLVYNIRNEFPFSTYGEIALIAIQNVAISVLVLQYSGKGAGAGVFVAGLVAAGYGLLNEQVVDGKMLAYFQAGAGILGVASKLPQIVTIAMEGGTGQLSAFAVSLFLFVCTFTDANFWVQVFNYLAGSLARVFTTLQEVDDKLILYGFLAGFSLNLVLALQMVYYWNSSSSKATTQTKLEPKGKAAISQATGAIKASGSEKPRNSPSTRRRG